MQIQVESDPTKLWIEILNQVFPTDVLLFAEAGEFPEFVAAWQVIMSVALRDTHQKLFQSSTLIIPKIRNEVSHQIEVAAQHLLDQKVNSENRKAEIQNEFSFLETSTFESEGLLRYFEQIPEGSAVGVLYAPFYRFPDIDKQETNRIQTWMGINYRVDTAEEIAAPHLIELVKRIIPIAQTRQLFVTLFCQTTSYYSKSFTQEFETNDSVMYVQASRGPENFKELAKIQELISETEHLDIADAVSQISKISSGSTNQAIALSHIYFKKHQFLSAWQTIEPVLDSILESESSTLILNTANIAFAAGRIDDGKELLTYAIKLGLDTVEDLKHAYILTRESHQIDLAEYFLNRMLLLYPTNRTTLSLSYDKLINERKYSEALGIAKQLHDDLGIKLCEAFRSDNFEIEGFIECARTHDKLEWALLASSIEAINRNMLELSESLVDKLTSEIGFSNEAVKIKVFLWGKKYFSGRELNDDFVTELEPVILYVAQHPNDIASRSSLQRLLEDELDELTALLILSFLLLRSIHSSFHGLDFSKLKEQWKQQKITVPSVDELEKVYVPLFGNILESLPKKAVVIGRGEIPSSSSKKIDRKFLGGLAHLIQLNTLSANPDYETFLSILHVLALACKELEDPSTDFLAIRLIISGLAQSGSGQLARDLAETSLQIASNQPRFWSWRYGAAWACYADAHVRTGNPLSALIMLTLSFYAWNGEIQNYDHLTRSYRLATRILRDLGLASMALEVLDLEKRLILFLDDNEAANLEIEQLKLSLEIASLTNSAGVAQLNSLLTRSTELLDESIRLGHELTPVLSLQATLFRLVHIAGGSLESGTKDKFDSLLLSQEPTISQQLRILSNPFPEKQDLLNALEKASHSNHLDDLVHQLRPVVLIAENAIQAACRSRDVEFFLMACTILSQPGLSIGVAMSNQKEYGNIIEFSEQAKSWLLSYTSQIQDQGYDPQLLEARSLVNQLIPTRDTFFKKITSLSVNDLSNILKDNEELIILSEDASGNLCRLLISKDSVVGPETVPSERWSKKSLSDWKNNFSAELGRWYPKADALEEYPSRQEVANSVAQLSIGGIQENHSLLLAPSSSLSTFPFALSNHDGQHLADTFQINTLPSVLSLLSSRIQNLSDSRRMKAWLGDPDTLDATILYVRDRLIPIFDAFDVEIVHSATPEELSEASVAFIMSHGGTGPFDSFIGITDAKQFFSPKDLAGRINGCGSAVLFVCSGAKGDLEHSSPEIRGLTRELLNVNTKAVISSSWSLNASIPEVWLPPFLESIVSELSFGEANFVASKRVRSIFDNPCAWAALQVYGDPTFTLLR